MPAGPPPTTQHRAEIDCIIPSCQTGAIMPCPAGTGNPGRRPGPIGL